MPRPSLRASTLPALAVLAAALGSTAVAAGNPDAVAQSAEPAPPSEGAGDPAARRISEIRWRGLRHVARETALFYLGIAPGEPLDPAALNRGLHGLWASGLFEDLQVHIGRNEAGGAALEIRVEERPRLTGIEVEGLDWATRGEVEEWLANEGLVEGEFAPLDRGALRRLTTEIEQRVRLRGQRRTRVGYRLEPAGSGGVRAVFTLERRPPVRIASIDFEGNRVFTAARLRRTLRHNKASGPISRLLRLDDLDLDALEADLDALRTLYRDHGYKNVVVHPPRIEMTQTPQTGDPRDEPPRRARVTLALDEGERWSLGGLSVSGNRAFSDQRLLALFERPPASRLRQSSLDAWTAAIQALYRSHGRLETRVALELRERPDRVADAVARVEEGRIVRVGRIEIEGNSRTEEKVLRRELPIQEGEPLDAAALQAGLARIERTGLFDFDDEPVRLRAADRGAADVVLSGREADPFRTSFGGGWSESDGLSSHLALDTPNLLGRGIGAGIRFETGGNREGVELSLTLPWIFERPQALGFELFERRTDYTLSSGQRIFRDQSGGGLGWVRSVGPGQTLRLRYTRAALDDLQTGLDADGAPISRLLSLDSSALRASWALDRLDEPLAPTSGWHLQATLEVAGGALGGDNRFVRPELALSFFQPLGRGRLRPGLAFKLEGGRIDGRGTRSPSALDTYFLGGTHSLRGFANRSISPRDGDDQPLRDELGFVLGGDSFLEAGVEAHLALGGPLSAVLFVDGGNAWTAAQSVDLSALRYSAGAELRIRLPKIGAPLRLIWSSNLDPLPGDRFDNFTVSFGAGF